MKYTLQLKYNSLINVLDFVLEFLKRMKYKNKISYNYEKSSYCRNNCHHPQIIQTSRINHMNHTENTKLHSMDSSR